MDVGKKKKGAQKEETWLSVSLTTAISNKDGKHFTTACSARLPFVYVYVLRNVTLYIPFFPQL